MALLIWIKFIQMKETISGAQLRKEDAV